MIDDPQFYSDLAVLDGEIERFATPAQRKPSYLDVGHGIEPGTKKSVSKPKAEYWWHHAGQMHYHPVKFEKNEAFDKTHIEVMAEKGHDPEKVTHAGRIDHNNKAISVTPFGEATYRKPPSHVLRSLIIRHPDYKIHTYD